MFLFFFVLELVMACIFFNFCNKLMEMAGNISPSSCCDLLQYSGVTQSYYPYLYMSQRYLSLDFASEVGGAEVFTTFHLTSDW